MSQFKVGDLAIIIAAKAEENLGVVVELVGWSDEAEIHLSDGGRVSNPNRLACWEVTAERLVVISSLNPYGFIAKRGAIPEKWLMPLRGDFTPERKKDVEVPA